MHHGSYFYDPVFITHSHCKLQQKYFYQIHCYVAMNLH